MATAGALNAGAPGALDAGAEGAEGGGGENDGRGVEPGKAVTAAGAMGLVSGTIAVDGGFIGAGLVSNFGFVGGGNADAGVGGGEAAPGRGGNGGRPDGSSAARLAGMAGVGSGGGGEALPGNGGKAEPPGAGNEGNGVSVLAAGRGGNGGRPGLFRLGGFDGNGAGGGGVAAPGNGGRAGKALLLPVKGETMSLALPWLSLPDSWADASITPERPNGVSGAGGSVALTSFS